MRRRLLTLFVALCVAAGCVVAGVWQWGRHTERSAAAALVATNYDADPTAVAELLATNLDPKDTWRPVVVVGRYVGDPVLLRGRPVEGSPAVHDLGVLEITQGPLAGATLLVDRGWLALTADATIPPLPDRPDGVVELVARVRPLESPGRAAPPGQVSRIAATDLLRAGVDRTLLPAYGVLVTEDGRPPAGLSALPRPEVSLGVNLSYAFQWWIFALGALVGGFLLSRRSEEAADAVARAIAADDASRGAAGPTRVAGPPPARRSARPSRRREGADEAQEDAIVDAQEASVSHGSLRSGSPHGQDGA